MSNPRENLEEIEALFLLNKQDNDIISELLSRLQVLEDAPEYIEYASIISSLKLCLTKQKLENNNFVSDQWKRHISFTETAGRKKINIDRNTLEYLLLIGMAKTEIATIFNVHRHTVLRWINDHSLNNLFDDPEDDTIIENYLQEVMNTYPNLGEQYAQGVLLNKRIKIKRQRLRQILKRLKQSLPLSMPAIRRRQYHTRTSNTMWHLDSTHKLIHWRFITSGCVDGKSRKVIWLKCADNNRADTTYNYFLNAIQEHQCPFQVRGDKGVENKKIAKHMIAIRGDNIRGFIGGKSSHNTRIERFWKEYNTNVMKTFFDEFTNLEHLGYLDRTDNKDLWVLHKVFLPIINEKLLELKTYYNNHPIRTENYKSPNQLYAANALRSQVINTSISEQSIDILHNWQNVYSPTPRNNVVVPSIENIIMNDVQIDMVETILHNNDLDPKSKYINIRAFLRGLN